MSLSYNALLVNKIIADFQKGEKHSSFDKLREFVNKNPKDTTARYNFALMCEELNYSDLAIDHYYQVIKKNSKHWRSKFNLYLIFINQKKYSEALKLINEVLNIKSNYQPALRDKAVVLYYLKKADKGLTYIQESLKQNPVDYIALNTLGLIYMAMEMYDEAKKALNQSIKTNPNYVPSYNNLGRCYSLQHDRKLEMKYYKKALELNPDFKESINNIANYYNETGSYEKAIQYYFKALEKENENPEILYNIGVAYSYLKEFNKAEEYYKKSNALNPDDGKLRKNYSMLLLAMQRYKEAWKLFDGRLGLDEFKLKNNYIHNIKDKLWLGEKFDSNKKILVVKEQGIGDEILYGSMYPDLLRKYPNLKIETDTRLISLFKRSFKVTDIFVPYSRYSKSKKEIKQFDITMYAGSLGRLFRNELSDFPNKSFLTADKNKCKNFKEILKQISPRKKIGLSWWSNNKTYGSDKSLDLNLLLPLIQMDQFSFINLQYGDTLDEIRAFNKSSKSKIINIDKLDLFNDFESIAALLKNLDLFITVSNSTGHLSAALGVPTWIIKPKTHAVFHYWNQPGNTTPWYVDIRLFSYINGWGGTINEIKESLLQKFK